MRVCMYVCMYVRSFPPPPTRPPHTHKPPRLLASFELHRELNRGQVGIPPRTEGELVELRLDRLDHLRMREADLVNIVAVKIQEATALKVLDVGALAMGQDIEAGSRKRLVQKKAAILRQEFPGFFVEILLYPFQPPGREVDVAL